MVLKDYFLQKKRDFGYHPTIKVCMMGPRAVGKTSILTAIFNEAVDSIATTSLKMEAIGDTKSVLTEKQRELNRVFKDRQNILDRPNPGIAASSTVTTFDFAFGVVGKEPRIDLKIKDFPGEYVETDPITVKEFIKESNAVMIAIDSPHIIESDGAYAEVKNKINKVSSFFKDSVSSPILVLLVPLKCEKYYIENRMDELKERVKDAYAELIEFIKSSHEESVCAITPILTLGDVAFDSFTYVDNKVKLAIDGCPAEVKYQFIKELSKYSPLYCAQPLYYLLSYVAAQYKRNMSKRGFLGRLMNSLFILFANDKELFDEIVSMERYRQDNLPGYEVLCGYNNFLYNR